MPASRLPRDDYVRDESGAALVGKRFGHGFQLGEAVDVRLVEAQPVSGGVVLDMLTSSADKTGGRVSRGSGGRGRARRGKRRRDR